MGDRFPIGTRVRKRPSAFASDQRCHRRGVTIAEPYQARAGHWFVDVRWDDSRAPESVYLPRLSREAP